jgi:hypothetical protein
LAAFASASSGALCQADPDGFAGPADARIRGRLSDRVRALLAAVAADIDDAADYNGVARMRSPSRRANASQNDTCRRLNRQNLSSR